MQYLRQAGLRLRVHPEDTGPGADLSAVEFAICECGPLDSHGACGSEPDAFQLEAG